MKRLALATAVLAIALAILVSVTIPPAQLILPNPTPDGSVPGVIHIHTNRSDGQGSLDEVAAAAAAAGLKFVVVTDHGDATAPPEPPAYRSGVLCIDSVEISTAAGHVLALDMPPSPYPLAGESRDVVEDVHRLGGFAVAAHPDSPKVELRWRDRAVPVDGFETLNLDTGWRMWVDWADLAGERATPAAEGEPTRWQARRRLGAALLNYPFRPVQTIASLIPPSRLAQYDELAMQRRVVSLPGADAHAKIAFRGDPVEGGPSLPIPGYEPTFRTMSVHVKPERALTGDPVEDARLVMAAIRGGHVYTALDAIATPPAVEFSATSDDGTAKEGDELRASGPVTLRVRSNMPADFMASVRNGSKTVQGSHVQEFTVQVPPEPGAYWVSIVSVRPETLGAMWIRTNPIYIRPSETGTSPPEPAPAPAANAESLFDGSTTAEWHVENDPNSQGAVDAATLADGPALRFRYGLGAGTITGPFVALARDLPNGVSASERVAFTIRSEQPMRVSVQLRTAPAGTSPGERWQRAIYVDATPRVYTVSVNDFAPVSSTRSPQVRVADVRSLLFVIDTVNTKPGASGRVWISNPRWER